MTLLAERARRVLCPARRGSPDGGSSRAKGPWCSPARGTVTLQRRPIRCTNDICSEAGVGDGAGARGASSCWCPEQNRGHRRPGWFDWTLRRPDPPADVSRETSSSTAASRTTPRAAQAPGDGPAHRAGHGARSSCLLDRAVSHRRPNLAEVVHCRVRCSHAVPRLRRTHRVRVSNGLASVGCTGYATDQFPSGALRRSGRALVHRGCESVVPPVVVEW